MKNNHKDELIENLLKQCADIDTSQLSSDQYDQLSHNVQQIKQATHKIVNEKITSSLEDTSDIDNLTLQAESLQENKDIFIKKRKAEPESTCCCWSYLTHCWSSLFNTKNQQALSEEENHFSQTLLDR